MSYAHFIHLFWGHDRVKQGFLKHETDTADTVAECHRQHLTTACKYWPENTFALGIEQAEQTQGF